MIFDYILFIAYNVSKESYKNSNRSAQIFGHIFKEHCRVCGDERHKAPVFIRDNIKFGR